MIWITLGIYAALSILAILLYIPKLAQYRYAFKKPPYKRAKVKRKISVVVPARGESKVIGDLFASIAKQDYDKAFFDVNVIVKDPDDPTVALAEKMGASLSCRSNPARETRSTDISRRSGRDSRSTTPLSS